MYTLYLVCFALICQLWIVNQNPQLKDVTLPIKVEDWAEVPTETYLKGHFKVLDPTALITSHFTTQL